nr:hypothetical protein [Tanacetum cinerariifolium]
MRELRRKLFKGTDDEDSVSYYTQGALLEMDNRLSAGTITTWDLLKKAFTRKYCPPFKTAKKLEEICNFKQEVADDDWINKFTKNMNSNIRALKTTTKNLQIKVDQLTQIVLTNASERIKAKIKMGKNDMKEPVLFDLPVDYPYVQPMPIPKRVKGQKAQKTTNDAGISTTHIPGPVTTEEKAQKKNDVKAKSMLLMTLPNEHLMTFNQHKDAKTLFAAIEIRFGGNEATKKTQKTLLKQLYENFSDLNLKYLRSLPSEWNTHVVVWRNKSDLDRMSIDDLYNNFKIVKQEVKGTTSTYLISQNIAFVSSPSPNSTNKVPTDFGVSTASPQVNLEQIHEDDLEEMDLKWQLALLSMRAKRFFQKTGKKIIINGSNTAGYDKAKVECFNCHKIGHFTRECEVPRNQQWWKNGVGFDWSYMADDEAPINMAFMDFLDSERGLEYVSYNAVPPPNTGRFSPLRIDLSHTGLPEFAKASVKSYGVKPIKMVTQTSRVKIYEHVKENNDVPLIEDWESEGEDEVESPPEIERKTVEPSVDKVEVDIPKQNDKPARRPVKYVEMYRTEMYRTQRPRVLTRIVLKPVNSVRHVNPKRSFQRRTTYNNRNFFQKVNTAKGKVNTTRPNSTVLNAVRANKGKAGHSYKHLEDQGYFDSGCSKHMTENISYLTDFKEFDGGYVAFRGVKGGKITGKGIIRIGKLDFEDVYFVKEL